MSLVQELIKPILEADKRTVAVYGGGFKPPTKGHFEVVAQAIKKNPNIDKFIVLIGGKERDDVTPEDSLLIWEIYKQYLPINVEIELSSKPPIQAVYNYAKDHPDEDVIFVIGAREGNEDDFKDIALRTKSVDNYPNLRVATIVTQGGASGTAARNAAKTDISKLKPLLPSELKDDEVEEIFNLISDKITEGRKNCGCGQDPCITYGITEGRKKKKDPKKGTGKKPKGSGRRLYTDEDPKDTVGIKFSTRQDIVDTLSKKSFKAKSHARQSQIINLIHQRVRAALGRTKDPAKKKKLKSGFEYIKQRKEASKKKTQRLKKQKLNEIGIDLSNYSGQVLPGDVLRAPKGFPLGGKKLEKSKQLKVIKNSREGVNRYKLSLEDSDGKKYTVRNFEMDGEYKGKKLPKWGLIRKSKKNVDEGDTYEKMAAKGKKAGSLKQGTVRKRLKIPKGKKIPLSLISKEISRMKKMDKDKDKKGVQLGDKNQKYYKALQLAKTLKTTTNLNEILNPATFDYKPIMASLTKSMENDGLNLQPYPTVRFIHDEEANADDFFGRTAYYNPNNKEIVLYTLGRHPKDIMRSYAHELIHVHQDNEDRLHDVQTDDVNADEHLEQLEREAYEIGNIMFRSWTNKITKDKNNISEDKKKGYKHKFGFNDKLGKDPFGLNMFARELALGLEEQEEKIDEPNIYLDMDGVVANFDKRFEDLSGMLPQAYVDKHGKNAFWDLIDEKHKVSFWRGIEIMPGANELVNFVSKYPYQMLTAPSVKKQSVIGKGLWVKDKVGTLYPSKPKVFYRKAKEKHMVKPNLTKNDILVDDRPDTIARWDGAGGTAVLYQSAGQVINDLKRLGL